MEIARGGEVRLDIPKLGAELRGSMKTYDGGKGFSHHGWAGPRLLLLPDDSTGWTVTVGLPQRRPDDSFQITGLPEGRHHVFQHLIGEPYNYIDYQGKPAVEIRPRNAWGGIPIELRHGSATILNDFSEYPFASLRLKLLWADGLPITDATLYIRDRMSDAWQVVARGPTTLAYAAHPIPMPPAVRVKDGLIEFPAIRKGLLEMLLVTDGGGAVSFTRDVDPARVNEIRLNRQN